MSEVSAGEIVVAGSCSMGSDEGILEDLERRNSMEEIVGIRSTVVHDIMYECSSEFWACL